MDKSVARVIVLPSRGSAEALMLNLSTFEEFGPVW